MRFLKKKVIVPQTKEVQLQVDENNNTLHVTNKVTVYDSKNLSKLAKVLNENVNVEFSIDDLKLEQSLFRKLADQSYQFINDYDSYEALLLEVNQIKRLLEQSRLTDNEDLVLKTDLEHLLTDVSMKFRDFKRLATFNEEIMPVQERLVKVKSLNPRKFSYDELRFLGDQIRSNRLEQFKENASYAKKDLIFNGYVLNKDQLKNLENKKLITIEQTNELDGHVLFATSGDTPVEEHKLSNEQE